MLNTNGKKKVKSTRWGGLDAHYEVPICGDESSK